MTGGGEVVRSEPVCVRAQDALDLATAPALLEELIQVRRVRSAVTVDLAAVQVMDSSGLRVLLTGSRLFPEFRLARVPERVERWLQILCLASAFKRAPCP